MTPFSLINTEPMVETLEKRLFVVMFDTYTFETVPWSNTILLKVPFVNDKFVMLEFETR